MTYKEALEDMCTYCSLYPCYALKKESTRLEQRKMKPIYKKKKWTLGRTFGWWDIPYCPHCKRQLGLLCKDKKPKNCPMCKGSLNWDDK